MVYPEGLPIAGRSIDQYLLPQVDPLHPIIQEAEQYVIDSHIEAHPFFAFATQSRPSLAFWAAQEMVVSNKFGPFLLQVGASIDNVHLRSMVVEVASGEHGPIGPDNMAREAHPSLLHVLQLSMGIPDEEITASEETEEFLTVLQEECQTPLRGVAALGVGNESLLIPEYTAVRKAFELCWLESAYEPFIKANVDADIRHGQLMNKAATGLISLGGDPKIFFEAAKRAIDARITYYDKLLERLRG